MSDFNEQNVGARWYVAHTYSGYENKVKMNLEKIIENRNLSHLIFDIRIPTETIVESNGGEEKEIEEKIFPAYVLIKMIMTDESWHVVRNIRGVTGFVGPGSKPVPLSDEEAEAIISESRTSQKESTLKVGELSISSRASSRITAVVSMRSHPTETKSPLSYRRSDATCRSSSI